VALQFRDDGRVEFFFDFKRDFVKIKGVDVEILKRLVVVQLIGWDLEEVRNNADDLAFHELLPRDAERHTVFQKSLEDGPETEGSTSS